MPVSLLPDLKKNLFEASEKRPGGTVSWCPPLPNWNPWNGCNIDDGPLAFVCQYMKAYSIESLFYSIYFF